MATKKVGSSTTAKGKAQPEPAAKKKSNPYGKVFSKRDIEDHVTDYKDNQKNFSGKYPVYMDIEEGEEAIVRFLQKDPIKFWQHRVFDPDSKKGKGGYRVFSCTREPDCPLCMAGDKPAFKVAWQIIHVDAIDESGNEKPRVKLFVKGIKFAEYYAKKVQKYDPTKRNVILERIGSGNNTQYLFGEWQSTGNQPYVKDEVIDLEDYFGLDDQKFADMERIAENLDRQAEYSGPKKGKKSRLEKDDDDDDDVPF